MVLLILLAGCAGRTHRIGFDLGRGDRATIYIKGKHPTVKITGPGAFDVVIDNTRESARDGNYEKKLAGPTMLRIENRADRQTVRVVTRGSTGLAFVNYPR